MKESLNGYLVRVETCLNCDSTSADVGWSGCCSQKCATERKAWVESERNQEEKKRRKKQRTRRRRLKKNIPRKDLTVKKSKSSIKVEVFTNIQIKKGNSDDKSGRDYRSEGPGCAVFFDSRDRIHISNSEKAQGNESSGIEEHGSLMLRGTSNAY